jgi:L,D-transpeptidase YcbB
MRATWFQVTTLRASNLRVGSSALALLLMMPSASAQILASTASPPASVPYSEVDAPAAAADAVTLAVRKKLAEPAAKSGFDAQERAALAAYYATDGAKPLWVDNSNLTPRALALSTELARADDWGLQASALDVAKLAPKDTSDDALADAEIRISQAALKYARFASCPAASTRSRNFYPPRP